MGGVSETRAILMGSKESNGLSTSYRAVKPLLVGLGLKVRSLLGVQPLRTSERLLIGVRRSNSSRTTDGKGGI